MSKNNAHTDVHRIYPVFSFPCIGGGDVYVYLVQTAISKLVIITFDTIDNQYAFTIQKLTPNSQNDAIELVRKAEKEFNYSGEYNPFTQLYRDHKAMVELSRLLASFYNGD
jgi:hypothetical protein